MKKNKYVSPAVEELAVTVEGTILALSAPDSGIHRGGNASDNGTPDPEAKDGGAWDIWR